jgi:hypothetical protein
MSGFLYFLPNERTYSASKLAEYGLTHAIDPGVSMNYQQVVRGPNSEPGVLIGAADRWSQSDVRWSERLKHRPFPKPHAAKQAMCCWLGDVPLPTPTELARVKQLEGQALTLADNQHWIVPHARRWENGAYGVKLPRTIDVDDDGSFVMGEVLPQYAAIWTHAVTYWDQIVKSLADIQAGESGTFTIDNPVQIIVDALATNYRVSARELGVLQSIDDQLVQSVLNILVDYAGMNQLKKKMESGTGDG